MTNRKHIYTDYYVYIHRKADTGDVFYVGKGTSDRAWQLGYKRNKHWNRVVAKHGLTVELVETGLTNEQSIEKEIALIAHYGIVNLCNMTGGGEGGGVGRKWSNESRKKLSESKKGKPNPGIAGEKNHMKTAESRARLSASRKGINPVWMNGENNPAFKLENRIATSIRCKGKKRPEITGGNHKLAKKVLCVETGAVFDCGVDAAKWLQSIGKTKAIQSNISSACTGVLKRAYGYHWKHA